MSTCLWRPGEGGRRLLHKNLIAHNMGFGQPVQRPDGFFESNMQYSVEDATYSVSAHEARLLLIQRLHT